MKDWIEKGYHEISGSGFMGKEWDAFVPQPIFWKEVFRVLKPGGHVLAFYGSRTYDWGVMAMRFAGFEVRDTITWHFGSGFPKSHNVAKGIESKILNGSSNNTHFKKLKGEKIVLKSSYTKKNVEQGNRSGLYKNENESITNVQYESDEAKQWDGWGSALKPASEYICLARKPLEKGLSIAENVLKWGVGAINIDGCRVGTSEKSYFITNSDKSEFEGNTYGFKDYENMHKRGGGHNQGRFPANLILSHSSECQHVGTKKVKAISGGTNGKRNNNYMSMTIGYKDSDGIGGYGDENGEETIEDWRCHENCPIKILDEQSGESKSQRSERGNIVDNNVFGKYNPQENTTRGHNDKGGASRFFYVAKASKSERNKGLEGFEEKEPQHDFGTDFGESRETRTHTMTKNFHPTVKPIKLMQYLVRLVTPPNGVVLDPFCGSGTTGIACKLEGFDFVGCEQDAEYTKIAKARIDNFVEDKKETKKIKTK
jgi:site-specific DNA-methyltransferase (adenine-specific)